MKIMKAKCVVCNSNESNNDIVFQWAWQPIMCILMCERQNK